MSQSWCTNCGKREEDCDCFVVLASLFENAREEFRGIRRMLAIRGTVSTPSLDKIFLDEKTGDDVPPTTITGATGSDGAA